MKRTISLIIAIAVIISMFVLPASAAEYVVDMSTLNGAARFTVAEGIPEFGVTSSDIGLHFGTGEPGAENGNVVDIPLDLSSYNTIVITYRNGAAVGDECADLQLQTADYTATIGTFDLKGTGGWGTTAEASLDISAVTTGSTNYRLTLQAGANGSWVTGIRLTSDGAGSTDPVNPPAGNTVTSASQIVAGNTTLTQDIAGQPTFSAGTYVIDLAGYKWTGQLFVSGTADVTLMDSSAEKTGVLDATAMGDAIDVSGSAKLTLDGVTVLGSYGSGDAVFVNSGTVVSNNSNLAAGKAGIDVVNAAASVTVNGGSFPVFDGLNDERRSAIELRNGAKVTLNGDITFGEGVSRVIARDGHSATFADSIVCGENATATFANEGRFTQNTNYTYADMTYTYSVPMGDPDLVGASVTLTNGIALNFIAEGVGANDYIMVKGVKFTGVAGTGDLAGKYIFAVDNFGPQAIGDDITAELYAGGDKVCEMTYSVADYCYDTINNAGSSKELVKLVKSVLNYGTASQVYKNYKVNTPANAGLTESEKDIATNYIPTRGAGTVERQEGFIATYGWHTANLHFGDTYKLVITFGTHPVNAELATSLPAYALYTTVEGGQAPNIRKEITQIDDGRWEIVFDDVLPTDFYVDYYIGIYDEAGNKLTNFINYSIKAYVSMNDNENRDREYDSVGLEEPVGPINDLVKSLQMYCIAAIEYEKSL